MRRGTTYRFYANGGDDEESSSEFHPLYLTASVDGGYQQFSPEERLQETVLAGIEITNQTAEGVFAFESTAAAPICVYKAGEDTTDSLSEAYEVFFETLDTSCEQNETITNAAAILEFTPDENTPDKIYYQCGRSFLPPFSTILQVQCAAFFIRLIVAHHFWFSLAHSDAS
jgi:hypothetical protein